MLDSRITVSQAQLIENFHGLAKKVYFTAKRLANVCIPIT